MSEVKLKSKSEVVELRVNLPHIAGEFQRRLYSKVESAYAEPIKNAIDAEAREVFICNNPKIVRILDYGRGMAREEVRELFVIGTSVKEGLGFIGEKGIGRLAAYKLGDTLEILTKSDEGSWRCVFRLGEIYGLMEEKEVKARRNFTLYKIYNSDGSNMSVIKDENLRKYLSEVFKLQIMNGLKIYVNGRIVEAQASRGKVIPFKWSNAFGELILNRKSTKFSFYVRGVKVSDQILHGVGGWVNCNDLQVSTNRENLVEDENYLKLVKKLESKIREEFRRLSDDEFKRYSEVLIHVALNLRDRKIASRIPVLTNKGLKKLGEIKKVAFEEGDFPNDVYVISSQSPYVLELMDLLGTTVVTRWRIEDLRKYISGKIKNEVRSVIKDMFKVAIEMFPNAELNLKSNLKASIQPITKSRRNSFNRRVKGRKIGIKPYFKLGGLKWKLVGFGEEPLSLKKREVYINVESKALKLAIERFRGKAGKIILAYILRKPILKALGLKENSPNFQEYMDKLFMKTIEEIAKK